MARAVPKVTSCRRFQSLKRHEGRCALKSVNVMLNMIQIVSYRSHVDVIFCIPHEVKIYEHTRKFNMLQGTVIVGRNSGSGSTRNLLFLNLCRASGRYSGLGGRFRGLNRGGGNGGKRVVDDV